MERGAQLRRDHGRRRLDPRRLEDERRRRGRPSSSTSSPRTTCPATTTRSRRCSVATAPGAPGFTAGPPRRAATASPSATTSWSRRAVDPVALERLRMTHMSQGYSADHDDRAALAGLRLVPGARDPGLPPQHRQAHRRPDGREAARPDRRRREPPHGLLPEPLQAALELAPDQAVQAILDVVTGVQDARLDIPGFQRKAVEMAVAGIYDLRSHRDEVVMPVLRYWKIFELEGLSPRGRRRGPSCPTSWTASTSRRLGSRTSGTPSSPG